jgi:hypothetical protein
VAAIPNPFVRRPNGVSPLCKEAIDVVARFDHREVIRLLLERSAGTYSEQAGIALHNSQIPLFQLLVVSVLGAARVSTAIAFNSAHALFKIGLRSPNDMCDADRRVVVAALDRGGCTEFDESTATRLRIAAVNTLDVYAGDLRRMERHAHHHPGALDMALRECVGVGPEAAAIFMREVQDLWDWLRPYFDQPALDGAARLGLPGKPADLAALAPGDNIVPLAAALAQVNWDVHLRSAFLAA